jgi:hypothetical protein
MMHKDGKDLGILKRLPILAILLTTGSGTA